MPNTKRAAHIDRVAANDIEQSLLAIVRQAHDEFAQNGFDIMAITMTKAEREIRELAQMARRARL